MTPKTNLSLALMVLIAFAAIQPCHADVSIKPYKIILTTEGSSDTIQVLIPMTILGEISDFQASLSFDGGRAIEFESYYYCPIDDILHVYFNKADVVNYLIEQDVSGEVDAYIEGSFFSGLDYVEFSGTDSAEIINPIDDTKHQNKVNNDN